jgi:hypothetical protein
MRMTMLTGWLCLLAACAGSTPADLSPPPDALLASCAAPLSLPDRDATQAEVERWWGRDRSALRACAARHGGLVAWAEGQLAAGR